ncbi:MAG: YDG domain-containing protein, partial [Methylobacter sp.]|nr:YDG domain-containing protein [Methylobacter sp.]
YTGVQTLTSINGADAGNYSYAAVAGDYTVSKLALAGSISTGNSTYGSAFTTGTTRFGNAVSGDEVAAGGTVAVNTSGSTSTSGQLKAGSYTGIQSVDGSLSGTDAGNYSFAGAVGDYRVNALSLSVTGITARNKVYDTNTSATLGGNAVVAALGSDSITLSGTASGVFDTKNVGTVKTVTVSGLTLSGTDVGNYNLLQQTGLTANITKANLAVTGVAANNKVFDATRAATLGGTAAVVALGNDVVIAGGGSGLFDDAHVGTGKAVAVSGFTLSGTDAGNYSVLQPTGLMADITAAPSTPVPEPTPVTAPLSSQESRRPPEPVRNVTSQLTANLTSPLGNNQPGTPGQSSFTKNTQESGQDSGDKPSSPNPSKELAVNTTMKIGDNGPTVKIVDGGVKFPGNNQANEKDSDEI